MTISRAQMGSQLKGNRVKLDKAGFDPTGDDAKDLGIIRMGKGGKTESKVNEAGNYTQPTKRKRICLLYTSPSPRDGLLSRMPSSA